MQLPAPLFSPSLKNKIKFLHFRNFLAPKKLNKTFLKFLETFWKLLALQNLNKTPLKETDCLSNLYYLLAAQALGFLIHSLLQTQSVRLQLVPCPSLCTPCVLYRMPCHTIGHQVVPTQLFLGKQRISLGVVSILRMCLYTHS